MGALAGQPHGNSAHREKSRRVDRLALHELYAAPAPPVAPARKPDPSARGDLPGEVPPPEQRPPGVYLSSEVVSPPHKIDVEFRTESPAARLRVMAPSPQLCTNLFSHMQPHVEAGARARVWDRLTASRLGVVAGALIGIAVGFVVEAPIGIGVGLLSAYALGSAGDWLVHWAFPPLELVEAWEKSRWSLARTYAWQGMPFAIALASILLTVVLASPGH